MVALYGGRVRSSEVLERTCRCFPKQIESLATDLSGECPTSATPDRSALAEADAQNAATALAAQHCLP